MLHMSTVISSACKNIFYELISIMKIMIVNFQVFRLIKKSSSCFVCFFFLSFESCMGCFTKANMH